MKSHIFGAAIALLLMACASDTEQKGLDQIAQIYGATSSYSKSFNSEVGKETSRKFNVKLSNSKLIDSLTPTVTTANVAWLMYESFTEEEKGKYTHIDVELISTKNDTAVYYYPVTVLEEISKKSGVYETFSKSLMDGTYTKIDQIKDPVVIDQPVGKGIEVYMSKTEDTLGILKSYHTFGIAENRMKGNRVYQFQGYLLFENGEKKPYLVIVDATPGKDNLVGFRFF